MTRGICVTGRPKTKGGPPHGGGPPFVHSKASYVVFMFMSVWRISSVVVMTFEFAS
jgi:hypothetical protein